MDSCHITQEECIDCQWCCRVNNTPIPGGMEYVYLAYVKGFPIYWFPFDKRWYTLMDKDCQHIGLDGCKIQDHKPAICKDWYCPWGPRINELFEIYLDAGQRIMKQLIKRGDFK